jgi:hypothetical protein
MIVKYSLVLLTCHNLREQFPSSFVKTSLISFSSSGVTSLDKIIYRIVLAQHVTLTFLYVILISICGLYKFLVIGKVG